MPQCCWCSVQIAAATNTCYACKWSNTFQHAQLHTSIHCHHCYNGPCFAHEYSEAVIQAVISSGFNRNFKSIGASEDQALENAVCWHLQLYRQARGQVQSKRKREENDGTSAKRMMVVATSEMIIDS